MGEHYSICYCSSDFRNTPKIYLPLEAPFCWTVGSAVANGASQWSIKGIRVPQGPNLLLCRDRHCCGDDNLSAAFRDLFKRGTSALNRLPQKLTRSSRLSNGFTQSTLTFSRISFMSARHNLPHYLGRITSGCTLFFNSAQASTKIRKQPSMGDLAAETPGSYTELS